MEQHSFYFEEENVLTQFMAAFDDIFVYRYDKDRVKKEKIAVRYVFGPKQRVLYDIVNQAKNLTLPVIAVNEKGIRRDPSRIQFKDQKMTRHHMGNNNVSKIPAPIPIILDIDVSFVANYKSDIDQIVSNFMPWCNPYFIISWKIPEEFGLDFIDELRTEVTWSGSVDYETPLAIDKTEKYKIIGNTSFNIKGWLFPPFEVPSAPIYVVHSNFVAVPSETNLDNYPSLSGIGDTDVILVSAYPEITNVFYSGIPVRETITVSLSQPQTFTFYGKRFGFNNTWYLSGQQVAPLVFGEVVTAKSPLISAYRVPSELITTYSDNVATIQLSSGYLSPGSFTIISANSAAWVRMDHDVVVI